MIRDDNTLEDLHGVILALSVDLGVKKPEFPIAPRFDEVIERIEAKLSRNRIPTRANWFSEALAAAKKGKASFEVGDVLCADRDLQKCRECLESGNKAHRRKTSFFVAPDGTAMPADKK